jgi:threonine synthase
MTMHIPHYVSTRGQSAPLSFSDAVLGGLATDGGLLVPSFIPDVRDQLDAWTGLPYPELAFEVIRRFSDLPEADLRPLLRDSYAGFAHPDVAPLVPVGPLHVLELFHGPTLAFKDVALQFLGRVYGHLLARSGGRLNIVGATSGDTGSAAIHAMRGRPRIRILIMHPHGRVAPAQERQMTTVLDDNVFNLAVRGTFDDCQAIMKRMFSDVPFKERLALGSINSVNWARVLAQVVYYFHAALKLRAAGAKAVRFAVPTGNFGDVLAGWYAWKMGLPISRLVLATNENDILSRFFATGAYRSGEVVPTLSPSMDIQVASNFERYLYYQAGQDGARVRGLMGDFARAGVLTLDPPRDVLVAGRGDTAGTLSAIRDTWARHRYLLDPHTAVGVQVAASHLHPDEPMVCLATAHPAKFPDAIRQATGEDLAHHPNLKALENLPTRCDIVPSDEQTIRSYVEARAG